MSRQSPLVSIIIPVYTQENHIADCLRSLKAIEYTNIEVILVTEELEKETKDTISSWESDAKIINYTGSKGISGALNKGITESNGKYIARLDADDLMVECRIKSQVSRLNKNPNVGVVSTAYEQIDRKGNTLGYAYPPKCTESINWKILFQSPFPHPGVMIRRSTLNDLNDIYRPEYNLVEDYDLWSRIAKISNLSVIDEPLLKYRKHLDNKSRNQREKRNRLGRSISVRNINSQFDTYRISITEKIKDLRILFGPESGTCKSKEEAISMYLDMYSKYSRGKNSMNLDYVASVQFIKGLLNNKIGIDEISAIISLSKKIPLGVPFSVHSFIKQNNFAMIKNFDSNWTT